MTGKRASRARLLGGRVQGKLVQGKGGQVARARWCESPQAMAESWEGASLCLLSICFRPSTLCLQHFPGSLDNELLAKFSHWEALERDHR